MYGDQNKVSLPSWVQATPQQQACGSHRIGPPIAGHHREVNQDVLHAAIEDLNLTVRSERENRERNFRACQQRIDHLQVELATLIATCKAAEITTSVPSEFDRQQMCRSADIEWSDKMEERIDQLKRLFDLASTRHAGGLEAAHADLEDIKNQVDTDSADKEERLSRLENQVMILENQFGESAAIYSQSLLCLESTHNNTNLRLDDLQAIQRRERVDFDARFAGHGERIQQLENRWNELLHISEKHSKNLDAANAKLKVYQSYVAGDKIVRDQHNASLQNRLDSVERGLSDLTERGSITSEVSRAGSFQPKLTEIEDDNATQDTGYSPSSHHNEEASIVERIKRVEHLIDVMMQCSSAAELRLSIEQDRCHSKIQLFPVEKHTSLENQNARGNGDSQDLQWILAPSSGNQRNMLPELSELKARIDNTEKIATVENFPSVNDALRAERAAREANEQILRNTLKEEKKLRNTYENNITEHLQLEKQARDAHHIHICEQLEHERHLRQLHQDNMKDILQQGKAEMKNELEKLRDLVISEAKEREHLQISLSGKLNMKQNECGQICEELKNELRKEKENRSRCQEDLFDQMESLALTMSTFRDMVRKGLDDQAQEARQLWHALGRSSPEARTPIPNEVGISRDSRGCSRTCSTTCSRAPSLSRSCSEKQMDPVIEMVQTTAPLPSPSMPSKSVVVAPGPISAQVGNRQASPLHVVGSTPASTKRSTVQPTLCQTLSSTSASSSMRVIPTMPSTVASSSSLLPTPASQVQNGAAGSYPGSHHGPPRVTTASRSSAASPIVLRHASPAGLQSPPRTARGRSPRIERSSPRDGTIGRITCGTVRYSGDPVGAVVKEE